VSGTKFYMSDGTPIMVDVDIEVFRKALKDNKTVLNVDLVGGKKIAILANHIVAMESTG
jgi:hypothetical protein